MVCSRILAAVGFYTLLLHTCCVNSQTPPPLPTFTVHPAGGVYRTQTEVTLRCEASGATSLQWSHNGNLVTPDARRTIGANLTIVRLNNDVAGNYTCLASNDVGTITSAVAEVQIAVLQANLSPRDNPRIVRVNEHQPIALNCGTFFSVPPIVPARIAWEVHVPGSNLPLQNNEIKSFNGSLIIQDPTVSRHNDKLYECSYDSRVGLPDEEGYVRLFVESAPSSAPPSPPHFIRVPEDVTVNVGEGAYFECIVGGTGLPTPLNITWQYPPTTQVTYLQENAQLRVITAQFEDAGTYTCVVTGLGERSATLTVRGSPVITASLPPRTEVTYDSPLTLTCSATGIDISWQWYHNGTLMEDATGPELSVPNAVEEDSGVYQCFAYNPAGNDSSVAVVRVLTVPANFIGDGLVPNQVAFMGQPFVMSCNARGAPPPQYSWAKDNVPLAGSTAFDISVARELRITSVQIIHNGTYRCTVQNKIGERLIGARSTIAQLFVIAPTVVTSPPLTTVSAQLNMPFTLPCNATHHPGTDITYSWRRDGVLLDTNGAAVSFISGTSGDITIANVQERDAGRYTCTVQTRFQAIAGAGEQIFPPDVSYSFNVTVTRNRVGPMIFQLTATSTTINVGWHYFVVTTNPPSMYAIELQSGSGGWRIVLNQSAMAITNATIRNLSPYTPYGVRVVAVFGDGERVGSEVRTVVTDEDKPAGSPTIVESSAINTTSLLVRWEPPPVALRNGPIESYRLQYRPTDSAGPFTSIDLPGNTTSYILTNLRENIPYDIRIAANTSAGKGPFTDVMVAPLTGSLADNQSVPFHQTTWFIVTMFVLVLVVIAAVVVVVFAVRHHRRKQEGSRKYHIRPASGFFGRGANNVSLSEDAVMDYESRSSRQASFARGIESVETASSLIGPQNNQYIPQFQSGPPMPLQLTTYNPPAPAYNAPAYINPPPFAEALKHRTHPPSASIHPEIPGTDSEWSVEQGSSRSGLLDMQTTQPHMALELHANGPVEYDYGDSAESDLAEKPSYSPSEGSEVGPPPQVPIMAPATANYATFV